MSNKTEVISAATFKQMNSKVRRNAATQSKADSKVKVKSVQHESALQAGCVRWFRAQYPKLRMLLFSIPNGGSRVGKHDAKGNWYIPEMNRLKAEGLTPGVSDLFLSVPKWRAFSCRNNSNCTTSKCDYAGFYFEMKHGKNKMSPEQKEFKALVESYGYLHAVVYTFDEFERLINYYLGDHSGENRPHELIYQVPEIGKEKSS